MTDRGSTRQLFSQTVVYGLGIMLNRSVSFILLPLYTNYFPPDVLGVFTLVQSLSIFLGFVYALGLETAFMKKFIDAESESEKTSIYSSTITFLLLSSCILSTAIFFASGNIAHLMGIENSANGIELIKIMSIVMVADTVYRIPMLFFRAKLQAGTYSLLNIASFFFNILFNIIFIVYAGFGIESVFYSYLLSVLVILAAALLMTRKNLKLGINTAKIKELLSYGFKFIFIGVFILVIDMSDRFFLKHYFGESAVGIYWANYRLASVMGLVIAAFRFSWTPFFLNLGTDSASKDLIAKVAEYFVFAGSLLFLFFGLMIDLLVPSEVFGLRFIDERYLTGIAIVPVVLLAYFFSGLYSTFNAAPFFTNNTRSLLLVSGAGFVINIILNIVLIPRYELMGAAAATLITYLLMSVIIIAYSQKIYRIDLKYVRMAVMFLTALIFFAVGFYFVHKSGAGILLMLFFDLALILLYLGLMNVSGVFRLSQMLRLLKVRN